MSTSATTLIARKLVKAFGLDPFGTEHFGAARPAAVLAGADVVVAPGSLTIVRGDDGCGRTTLLRCLSGTYRPDLGSIVVASDGPAGADQVDLATADPRTVAWIRATCMTIFDGRLVAPPRMSAVAAVARRAGIGERAARAALTRLGAAALSDVPVGRLRSEAAKRVALVAALAKPAPVVVLDEPTAAAEATSVDDWIDERRAGGDAVVVSSTLHVSLSTHRIATGTTQIGTIESGMVTWQKR